MVLPHATQYHHGWLADGTEISLVTLTQHSCFSLTAAAHLWFSFSVGANKSVLCGKFCYSAPHLARSVCANPPSRNPREEQSLQILP